MAKHSIAFVTMIRGAAVEQVMKGITESLNRILGATNYDLIDHIGIINEHYLSSTVKDLIIQQEIDLVICAGDHTTTYVYEISRKRKRKTPIIFCGVLDPVKAGFIKSLESSQNHLSGVVMKYPTHLLPAQLILKLNPNLSSILIPYRPELQAGRIEHDARQAKKYFAQHRVKTTLLPITAEEINLQKLKAKLACHDIAVSLEGGLNVNEVNFVSSVAKQASTPFWTDGEQAIEHGAMFALKNDFNFIGAVAAEQAGRVLLEEKHPSEVPIRVLPSSRYVEINNEMAVKKGLVLTDEIEVSIDEAFNLNRELATMRTLFVRRHLSCFTESLVGECGLRMRSDNEAAYLYRLMHGWQDATPKEQEMMLQAFVSREMKGSSSFIVFEDKIALQIYKALVTHKQRKPIIVVTHEHEADHQNWYNKADQHGIEVIRLFIPRPSLVDQLNILQHYCPQMTELNIMLWGKNKEELCYSTTQRLVELEQACTNANITLNKTFTKDEQWSITMPEAVIPPDSFWLFCEDNLPHTLINSLSEHLLAQKAVGVSSNLGCARRFPFSFGLDYRALSTLMHTILKRSMEEKRPALYRHVEFDRAQLYRFNINHALCIELGIETETKTHPFMFSYGLVPVDHSLDTARVLNILSFPEHEALIREKKARKKRLLKEPGRQCG